MRTIAAVARAPQADLELVSLELEAPRGDEVLVRLVGAGICHTDLMVLDEPGGSALPLVLGHEGSGIVEQVGAGVRGLTAGDKVVLTWDSCGECRHCLSGVPAFCPQFPLLNLSGRRADGSTGMSDASGPVGGHFFGQSSFSTHVLSRARNTIKVPGDTPLEVLRVLGPLGCGVQTGAGAVLTAFNVPPRASVAVWGAGGVGLSAVMAAATRDCHPIVAVDRLPDRLALALELGATHVIDALADDVVEQILEVSGGVAYAIETTGLASVVARAMRSLGIGGHLGLHGRARLDPGGMDIAQMPPGRTATFLIEGQCVPQVFIPQLLDLFHRGRLPFDRLITQYRFEEINRAVADVRSGASIKPLLTFDLD